jgi:hypothetical protein
MILIAVDFPVFGYNSHYLGEYIIIAKQKMVISLTFNIIGDSTQQQSWPRSITNYESVNHQHGL